MTDDEWLATQFETRRPQLQSVAYRMLGSLSEADDALQEAWLRIGRTDTRAVANLGGWLTTVVSRVCLDMLRSRKSRREEPLDAQASATAVAGAGGDPEHEAILADSVGIALLVVLDTLAPAERLAFVLHDVFGVPFEEIAPIVERSPAAARQLASRARRRVHGAPPPASDLGRQRAVVDAFLAAARSGDFGALLVLLDPGVVLRSDRSIGGQARELRGAAAVASSAIRGGASAARPALIDGAIGVVVAPRGRLMMVLRFTIANNGTIVAIEAIADPAHLGRLSLAVAPDP